MLTIQNMAAPRNTEMDMDVDSSVPTPGMDDRPGTNMGMNAGDNRNPSFRFGNPRPVYDDTLWDSDYWRLMNMLDEARTSVVADDSTSSVIGGTTGGEGGSVTGGSTPSVIGDTNDGVGGAVTGGSTPSVIGGTTDGVGGAVTGGSTPSVIGGTTGGEGGSVTGGSTPSVIGGTTGGEGGSVTGGSTPSVIGGTTGGGGGSVTGGSTPSSVIGGTTGGGGGAVTGGNTPSVIGGTTGGGSKDQHGISPAPPKIPKPEPVIREIAPPFKVLSIDYREITNRFLHHTDSYEQKDLIIRRGQEFKLTITVDRPFTKDQDVLMLQLCMGKTPLVSKGTMFMIKPQDTETLQNDEAGAVITDVSNNPDGSCSIKLTVMLPFDAVISKYSLAVRMRNKEDTMDDSQFIKYKHDKPFYVLFNPWCKEDAVYLENDDERKEYVLNDIGILYRGAKIPRSAMWYFGQFDDRVLEAAIYLMDHSDLPPSCYGDPVRLSRSMSAMVNSNGVDQGVLTGNWSGKYDDGVAPTAWIGSPSILLRYLQTEKPVKYGQCWVFSGVVTTVCRALGLPARSITNFSSAHDKDVSMTIDMHYNADTKQPIEYMNDSIWNFHVWNEVWMKRSDLPSLLESQGKTFDGWQIIDATPQELSGGTMQCGPASRTAIKEGLVYLPYDVPFVFAEVNGELIKWDVSVDGERTPIEHDMFMVGKMISTKAVGASYRHDVTDDYKYVDGSEKERMAVKNASFYSSRRGKLVDYFKSHKTHDVAITFTDSSNEKGDFHFIFKAVNTTEEKRTINARFFILSRYYTGVTANQLTCTDTVLKLEAKQEKEFTFDLAGRDWLNKVAEDAMLSIDVYAWSDETSQIFTKTEVYDVEKPDLLIELSKTIVTVGDQFTAKMSFTNPLDINITGAYLLVEGAGLTDRRKIMLRDSILPEETVTETLQLVAHMAGPHREILATFNCKQLSGIQGSAVMEVTPI